MESLSYFYREIKQGMMQQLLTGKIRLLEPQRAEVTT